MDKYIKDPSGKTLGIIKTQGGKEVAYDAGCRNLGSYSNGKTYTPGLKIITSGNTLASLIVLDLPTGTYCKNPTKKK